MSICFLAVYGDGRDRILFTTSASKAALMAMNQSVSHREVVLGRLMDVYNKEDVLSYLMKIDCVTGEVLREYTAEEIFGL